MESVVVCVLCTLNIILTAVLLAATIKQRQQQKRNIEIFAFIADLFRQRINDIEAAVNNALDCLVNLDANVSEPQQAKDSCQVS